MKKPLTILISCLLLAACAELPRFDNADVDKSLLPSQVIADIAHYQGKAVQWGGAILSGKNLKDSTRLEVLTYPLDSDGWPQRDQKPLGRFILSQQGYLETADYAKGRVITVVGIISGTEQGKVGDSAYTYPVIRVRQLYLWPNAERKTGTRVHFGVGVIFH